MQTTQPGDELDRQVVDALLSLCAEEGGWPAGGMVAIADRAQIAPADLYTIAPEKADLLAAFGRVIDRAMLAEGPTDPDDPPRDRLFEAMMRRFDQLSRNRDGVIALLKDLRRDPVTVVRQIPGLERSMQWTLDLAGIETRGVMGALRVRGLCVVAGLVTQTWMEDDSPDMARTMKALDSRLAQAEEIANTIARGPRRKSQSTTSESNNQNESMSETPGNEPGTA